MVCPAPWIWRQGACQQGQPRGFLCLRTVWQCEFAMVLHNLAPGCAHHPSEHQSQLFEQTVPRRPTVSHLFVRPPQLLAAIPQSSLPSSPLHVFSCYDNFRNAFVEFFRGVKRSWIMLFTKLGSWCPLCIFSHDSNLLSFQWDC